jgi:hypothetical protein
LSLILIFFLSGSQEQLKCLSGHLLSNYRASNACRILEPHCTRTEIVPARSGMANWFRKQDLSKENFGKLGVNFPHVINSGLTNAKSGIGLEQHNNEFATLPPEEVARKC